MYELTRSTHPAPVVIRDGPRLDNVTAVSVVNRRGVFFFAIIIHLYVDMWT